ncbi:MAG: FeoA family protein [Candidatus Omnitrophota bacterium]
MKTVSLARFKTGEKGRIHEIQGTALLQNRLSSMGLYPGREIVKMSQFAMRGPVAIKVGRGVLAVGHTVAAKIFLETA